MHDTAKLSSKSSDALNNTTHMKLVRRKESICRILLQRGAIFWGSEKKLSLKRRLSLSMGKGIRNFFHTISVITNETFRVYDDYFIK